MCGRAFGKLLLVSSIPLGRRPSLNTAASWNVAPTQPLPIVRCDSLQGMALVGALHRYERTELALGVGYVALRRRLPRRFRATNRVCRPR
jgi:hypothetical protein